jgi:hypothetical protein
MTAMPRSAQNPASAPHSSFFMYAPVGLLGATTTIARVRGETADAMSESRRCQVPSYVTG